MNIYEKEEYGKALGFVQKLQSSFQKLSFINNFIVV
jgi:hypothetical protein